MPSLDTCLTTYYVSNYSVEVLRIRVGLCLGEYGNWACRKKRIPAEHLSRSAKLRNGSFLHLVRSDLPTYLFEDYKVRVERRNSCLDDKK